MSQKPQKKRHAKGVDMSRYGYLFIMPFFLVYLIFQAYPLFNTIYLAFQRYMITGTNKTVGPEFYGLKNFENVLTKGNTIQVFQNTAIMWIINFIPQILLALLLAKWFTDTRLKLRGQGAIKVMIYMPNIITAASISVLFYSLFAFPQGPANSLLAQLGIIDKATYLNTGSAATVAYRFLEKGWSVRLIVAFINFWMWYGNTMIVLVAGILGISPSLFEAAEVDGAGAIRCYFHIALPVCRPAIGAALALSFADCWNLVEQPMTYLSQRTELQPLSVMFNQLVSQSSGVEFAGAVLYILPALFIYLYFLEDILSGIQLTELK